MNELNTGLGSRLAWPDRGGPHQKAGSHRASGISAQRTHIQGSEPLPVGAGLGPPLLGRSLFPGARTEWQETDLFGRVRRPIVSLLEQAEEGVRAAGFRFSLGLRELGKASALIRKPWALARAGSPAL